MTPNTVKCKYLDDKAGFIIAVFLCTGTDVIHVYLHHQCQGLIEAHKSKISFHLSCINLHSSSFELKANCEQ